MYDPGKKASVFVSCDSPTKWFCWKGDSYRDSGLAWPKEVVVGGGGEERGKEQ